MRNYFTRSRSSRLSSVTPFTEKKTSETSCRPLNTDNAIDDGDSTTERPVALPPPFLKVKRVDHYWSGWSRAWRYRNTGSGVALETVRPLASDSWENFCFVVVRCFPHPRDADKEGIACKVIIKSPYLLQICKDVIKRVPGVSWTAEPLELDPQLLLVFFPEFKQYQKQRRETARTQQDNYTLMTLGVLLDYLRRDYHATLAKISNLTTHGEIAYDLLYSIFVPGTIIVTECPVTGETRALRILSAKQIRGDSVLQSIAYRLLCESVDSLEDSIHGRSVNNATPTGSGMPDLSMPNKPRVGGKTFGRVQTKIYIDFFSGTKKINSLAAYPLRYHPNPDALKDMLTERGRSGVSEKVVKYNINSRVMIDIGNFLRLHPNYRRPKPSDTAEVDLIVSPPPHTGQHAQEAHNDYLRQSQDYGHQTIEFEPNVSTLNVSGSIDKEEIPLNEEDFLLATSVLFGFSLADKIWLELNVQHVTPIVWNEEVFDNLVLADDRKHLLRSLVDAHSVDLGFDDFVKGKGQGLIINLFGPPGVGKTLSAEATSERVHRPLYVVGGGDLGTKAADVDAELSGVFDIASSWKAIVLIDEADVFLERRSLHDLERNAMVAVFLRHIEYYRGILFLTTNRVTVFDPAFISRIHVGLHFGDLTPAARAQVWRAFLRKAGVSVQTGVHDELVRRLATREVNGRHIKNACRTAQSLAYSRGEALRIEHLEETLDAMEDFNVQFAAMTAVAL
ncbi:hypothetical protein BN946_scf184993.g5 [Trametes cinnabarina]|uniref:AAA+ ATPase domain-containing protein n=1 Tax=Pycnoporus cinnabarinus TaxID=5643 RepID=A0A060ST73_PYCCI|nr:hypothetical protein BN946_scf184993.g5 [Trametes cinnabarina]